MSNLPSWPHASKVYSRAYRVLKNMVRAGCATAPVYTKGGKLKKQGYVSEEMNDFIDALNKGNEEKIKWYILENIKHI